MPVNKRSSVECGRDCPALRCHQRYETTPQAGLLSTNRVLTPDASSFNDPMVYQAAMPGSNGISSGRSLARMYAATVSEVEGVRLLTEETVRTASAERVN